MFATGMYKHSLQMSSVANVKLHLDMRPYRKTQDLFVMKCQRLTDEDETRGAKIQLNIVNKTENLKIIDEI